MQERAIQGCCRGETRDEEDMAKNSHHQGAKGAGMGNTDAGGRMVGDQLLDIVTKKQTTFRSKMIVVPR